MKKRKMKKDWMERRKKLKKENDKKEKELKRKMDSLSNTKGRIIFRTEYEGKGPDIPPTRVDNKLELISIQKRFQELIRKYNKFDYPFDVNDPRNVAFVEEMKKGRLDLTLKLIYQEYLLNFNEFESLRHYLLKKRNEKSSLKKLRFPILEHDIESDPKLKQIIDLLKAEDARETINAYDRDMDINAKLQKLEEGNPERFFMTNKEFFEFLGLKTKVMKQDIVHYETMKTYREVINEAEIYADPIVIVEQFCVRLFSKARKLAPLTFKPPPVKLEATNSLRVNIHIVKGYNIPVRFNSFQNDYIEHFQLEAAKLRNPLARDVYVDQNMGVSGAYSGGGGGLSQNNSFNMGMAGANLSGSFGLNPSINNTMFNPNAMVNPYNTGDYFTSNNIKLSDKIQYLAQFEKKINSFIEIRVVYYDQEKTFRTDSVEGIHPDYNQHLEFEIKPSNGKDYFTREELAKCPGVFYFTLYDQVRHDGVAGFDDEIRLQVFQNRFLGSFTIPFVTIFQNASLLDTLCKVDVPKTIFGYYSDTSDTFDVRKRFGEDINRDKKDKEKEAEIKMEQKGEVDRLAPIKKIVDPFSNTYVSLYITLDPVPNFSKNEDDDYVAGYEDSVFLINGTKWLKELKTQLKFKDRNIRLFAENFDGYSVFMPRYLKPEGEKPPDEIFDISATGSTDPKAIEVAARYVALIPFVEDSQTWSDGSNEDLPDAWCTDKEFLQLGKIILY
ncbi:MAG: hypothetical protein MJ252_06830 [archaeon]|nr:hypothetical protein [archaeon]